MGSEEKNKLLEVMNKKELFFKEYADLIVNLYNSMKNIEEDSPTSYSKDHRLAIEKKAVADVFTAFVVAQMIIVSYKESINVVNALSAILKSTEASFVPSAALDTNNIIETLNKTHKSNCELKIRK